MRYLVKLFIRLHFFVQNKIGIKFYGLGKIQKLLLNDFVFTFSSKYFYYQPGIEGSYDYLLINKSNEPETHKFFERFLPSLPIFNFVDVGASIGEFVLGVTNYDNVMHIFAFEPRPDCIEVLKKNKELNNENRITIFEKALSNEDGFLSLHLNAGGTSSGIFSTSNKSHSIKVSTTTLDKALPSFLDNTVILIDVEGAEPLVMEGGSTFIKNNRPLIIFEYNQTSKNHFNLKDIHGILGIEYQIYRIKHDGSLDQDFSNSWNCVAIHRNSLFNKILIKNN